MTKLSISGRNIGIEYPTYFIADIAANHDGDLDRALHLMTLAKKAGAECAKFQHFRAEHIVSDYGFRSLGENQSHQANWSKSVFEVYQEASLPWEWTQALYEHSLEIEIEFMSAPYDLEAVQHIAQFSNAIKIGSGDINHLAELRAAARMGLPVLLATGASDKADIERALDVFREYETQVVLMQCNTNYTGEIENCKFVNLNVLKQFAAEYPNVILGLSDHTPGNVTVLGAVALGARVIEKHFTDDTSRVGPDHSFSLDPKTWREMVDATRILENSLGDGIKKVEENEWQTVVLQRRCVRVKHNLSSGHLLTEDDIEVLRPAPMNAIKAHDAHLVIGKKLKIDVVAGQDLSWEDLD